MSKVTGLVEILVNGKLMLNKAGAIARGIHISGQAPFNRNPVLGDSGIHGHVEEMIVPEVEFTMTDRDDISINALAVALNATIIYRAKKGGKAYTLNDAFMSQPAEITAGEGETSIKFSGTSWTEHTNPA